MKPYFVKYLPVEGEIKEGVTVLLDGKTPAIVGPAAPDLFEGCPVVKLFLCSRDIKVGDTNVWDNEGAVLEGPITEGDLEGISFFTKVAPDHPGNQHYKVIGEISPDALGYVKEGDEFEEDQVQYWPLKGGTVPSYKIKGPCGHFH